ncbi:MAG: hypothetical protein MI861_25905, partial [Pirellulales bacterium]|nr:hypothetical protein [Pirellulales bacterium]
GNLYRLFVDAGAADPMVTTLPDRQRLEEPEQFWTVAMGSGFRWEIDQLTPNGRRILRERVVRRIAAEGIDAVETNALHAVARKPG